MHPNNDVLLIDIGNSRLKWRLLRGTKMTAGGEPMSWASADSLGRVRNEWKAFAPSHVVASNVGGAVARALVENAVATMWGLSVGWITASAEQGDLRNGYRQPADLGPDRWAALLGARRRIKEACVVIDCGSAITIDLMDCAGRHIGGLISPGLLAAHQALGKGTAALGGLSFEPGGGFGIDTASCVNGGIFLAAVGFIEKGVALAEQQVGKAQRLITGGDAELLKTALGESFSLEPELVFEGLALIAHESLINQ